MKDSPKMKEVVEQLAQMHGVDLTQIGTSFRLDLPNFDCLVVERINNEKISVAHLYEVQDQSIPEPDVEFYLGIPQQWIPMNITQTFTGFVGYAVIPASDQPKLAIINRRGQADLAEFTEQWARNIEAQGWVENGQFSKFQRRRNSNHGAALLIELGKVVSLPDVDDEFYGETDVAYPTGLYALRQSNLEYPQENASPKMASLLAKLAIKHGLDTNLEDLDMSFMLPGGSKRLWIYPLYDGAIMVARMVPENEHWWEDPLVIFHIEADRLVPQEIRHSFSTWAGYIQYMKTQTEIAVYDGFRQPILANLTDYIAHLFSLEGWLELGQLEEDSALEAQADIRRKYSKQDAAARADADIWG